MVGESVAGDFEDLMSRLDDEPSEGASVLLHTVGRTAVVTLANTARRNAMTLQMWADVEAACVQVAQERSIAALVLRGAGTSALAAGADISEFAEERHDVASATRYNGQISRTLRAMAGLGIPTVAAVRGFTVGGGCELAHACDLRIADATARVGVPVGNLGVVLGVTEATLLVRHIGVHGLKRVLYSGRLFDAEESLRMGLVDEVAPEGALWRQVGELLDAVARSRPVTVRAAKVVTDMVGRLDDREAERLHELLVEAYGGRGLQEGVDAFLGKRTPDFDVERVAR